MLGMKLGIFATSRWAIATTGMGRLGGHLSSRKIVTIHVSPRGMEFVRQVSHADLRVRVLTKRVLDKMLTISACSCGL